MARRTLREYFSLDATVAAAGGTSGTTSKSQAILFLGVLAGAVAKVVWDVVGQVGEVKPSSVGMALIGSAVTFPTIYYGNLDRGELTFSRWFLAFQYGFFWQFAMDKIIAGSVS